MDKVFENISSILLAVILAAIAYLIREDDLEDLDSFSEEPVLSGMGRVAV